MKNQLWPRESCYTSICSYWQAEQILYRNMWSRMNILLTKRVFRTVDGVNQAITCKNQVCTRRSCDTLFFSHWQAEQILYRNIWSKMNSLPIKWVFRTVNGVNQAITWSLFYCNLKASHFNSFKDRITKFEIYVPETNRFSFLWLWFLSRSKVKVRTVCNFQWFKIMLNPYYRNNFL